MIITSKQNANIQKIVALQSKKGRREYRQFFIEGKKQVQEALKANMPIVQIVLSESFIDKNDILKAIEHKADISILEVSEPVFAKMSMNKTPQGILAVLSLPNTTVCSPQGRAILLDEVSDCGNLGTILRSANAFGVRDIYLKNCVDPFAPKSVQASMSGLFFVRLHIGSAAEIATALQDIPLIAADLQGVSLKEYTFPKQCCLVLGNEGNGISNEIKAICNESVTIPMCGSTESLNVAIAASILLFNMQNQ